jgi:predicted PurR-regulated permease PerM
MINIELSPRQQNIVAAGITTVAAAIVITASVVFVIYIALFFKAFDSVFLPLAVAAVFAMVLDPWYGWLKSRTPVPIALILVFLSILLPLALIVIFFGALIVTQFSDLMDQLPVIWAKIVSWFQANRPKLDQFFSNSDLGAKVSETLKTPGGPLAAIVDYSVSSLASAGSGIVSAIVSFLGWVIVPVYLAFLLMMPRLRPESLKEEHFPFLKPDTASDIIYLVREFFKLVVVFFRGQILIALLQGILFAIGFSLAGLKYGAILGLMLGFLNIVPYLGSMIGLSVCLPMAWFQDGGGMTMLTFVIAVFCLVQLIESYFLTPKIMGNATGLSPLAIIVGIFFWGAALNGILGMILAIPLTAFAVVLWRLAKEKYIGQVL